MLSVLLMQFLTAAKLWALVAFWVQTRPGRITFARHTACICATLHNELS
jgi:hypothetical protein